MKIHRLEIEGFGPFRDRQCVDFDAVAHDGVFLIAGKTGAGKSSILDAICFALYADIPRYDDGDRRVRSDHAALDEPTRVVLEFTNGDRRLRVERVPSYERAKKSGTGTTVSAAQARLSEFIDGAWVDIAARSVDVANELADVLRVTKAQFLQVILLAQGRFAEFLHARNDDRQRLLRTLFGSHRFSDYEALLDARRKEVAETLEFERRALLLQLETAEQLLVDAGVEVDPDADEDARREAIGTASLHAAHESEIAAADERALRDARDAADATYALVRRQRESQERRDRARAGLAALEARIPEIERARSELAQAVQAEALRGILASEQRVTVSADDAEAAVEAARAAWHAAGERAADDHEARIAELAAVAGALGEALRAEEALPELRDAAATADTALARIAARRDEHATRRAALPETIAGHLERVAAAAARAEGRDAATARVAERHHRLGAAREATTLADSLRAAEAAALSAGRALTVASATLDDLRERRFRDHAGELAETLVDGEPCMVCGAVEHPFPAARGDDPVTPDDIDAATAAKDAAIETDAAAAVALRSARAAHADAAARAGGLDVAAAEDELALALAEESDADAAARERDEQEALRAAAVARLAVIEDELAALDLELQAADRARVRAQDALAAATDEVERARGDHPSVAERLAAVTHRLALGRRRAAAESTLSERRAAAAAATREVDSALERSSFADRDAARAALRDDAARAALDATVREHEADLVSHRGTLMDLELEALPEEPIDPIGAAIELAEATERWRAAVDRHVRLRGYAGQLAVASGAADAAHDLIAERAGEAAVITELANAVAGRAPNTKKMDLETFVLAAELEKIVAAANTRLTEMTDGRYLLQHSDALAAHGRASGLGLAVMDLHTGHSRPVQSLSGGETFLASLALALGLAQVVTAEAGGVRLDTLFIDEGFGSLDRDTLDIAMRTLDELRVGGRTVGVISHVEAMQADLPAGIVVEATPEGPSVIRQAVAAYA
ncbi:AAA family ATPase [Microbacterium sp. SLBN-146]|uniref:AAA family ATPase n=1 Tax=Microbacterium sp. SLBN-146 TaxID=2768457 RepID=UPI0011523ECE|nr:SMC family ATPase [Microbacterium sp. SLBN-146]TQJ30984.1 exonuclease SbcC [Microbacterium sp. SLBN-146]